MNSEELRFLELLPERLVGRLSRRGSLWNVCLWEGPCPRL
jgi:hypothetical protein